uniref:Uncharacterized protein n=1 Tax=Ditylenchus dipsaci TaxID=166011 RepID=A0A915EPZ2_9BILA
MHMNVWWMIDPQLRILCHSSRGLRVFRWTHFESVNLHSFMGNVLEVPSYRFRYTQSKDCKSYSPYIIGHLRVMLHVMSCIGTSVQ